MAKPGRNDPCSCGSGRKFKQCCGNIQSIAITPSHEHRAPIATPPRIPEAFHKAARLHESGQLSQAESLCRQILRTDPNQPDTLNLLGWIVHSTGDSEAGAELLGRAIRFAPGRAVYHYNLAQIFTALNRLDEAAAAYQTTLSLKPDYAEAYSNLGSLFARSGQKEKAAACYQKALAIKPNLAETLNDLGCVFKDLNRLDEALACYQKAVTLKPDHINAYKNLAIALREHGKFDDAMACYDKVLAIQPDSHGCRVIKLLSLPTILPQKREWITTRRAELVKQLDELGDQGFQLQDPFKEVNLTNFYLAYQGLNDRELQQRIARFYLNACPELAWTAPHIGNKTPGGKLRLGICSSYFYSHTIGKLTKGLIDRIDRSRFEVVVIHSALGKQDHVSQAIDRAADQAVRIPPDLFRSRQMIATLELDALFYPDIGMDPLTYFLAFARLAPVQAVSWGHPVTTGIPNVDYFLSSRLIEPENAQDHYSEKLVEFEHLPSHYYRPKVEAGPSRAELGLPTDASLYICPQSLFKFHPDFDHVLGELLRRDPKGQLVLISGASRHWDSLLQARFTKAFPDVVDRVGFMHRLPNAWFINMLDMADAVLDPPFFGGGNTSYESFSVGAPIVTWPGPFMRGRVTLGCYQSMGFTELIAQSTEEYISLAIRLAHDSEFHRYCKNEILRRSDALYENSASVKEIENFFRNAVATATETTPRKLGK